MVLFPFLLLVLVAIAVWDTSKGFDSLRGIAQFPPTSSNPTEVPPMISVVVAARNEELHIGGAVRSLLEQDYPSYEVIVVNDRSNDDTGEILKSLQAEFPELNVVDIDSLPDGWIGKNYALWRGAEQAKGEWILFADADIHMDPEVFGRAMSVAKDFDHVTILPDFYSVDRWVGAFALVFTVFFLVSVQPWRLKNPSARYAVGIGAFNLIRRKVYKEIGTHQAIALRPDDDVKLGKLVKLFGFRQELLIGRPLVKFEFYPSLLATIRGFEKNFFAGLDYSVFKVFVSTLALLVIYAFPWMGVVVGPGWLRVAYALVVGLEYFLMFRVARKLGHPRWRAAVFPFGVALFIVILWESTFATLLRSGVLWRETFYPLEELRRNTI